MIVKMEEEIQEEEELSMAVKEKEICKPLFIDLESVTVTESQTGSNECDGDDGDQLIGDDSNRKKFSKSFMSDQLRKCKRKAGTVTVYRCCVDSCKKLYLSREGIKVRN